MDERYFFPLRNVGLSTIGKNMNINEGLEILAKNHGKGLEFLATSLETSVSRLALGIVLGSICLAIGIAMTRTTETRTPESNAAVLGKYNLYVCTSRL